MLKIEQYHSEGGAITGYYVPKEHKCPHCGHETSLWTIDCTWGNLELWINGECNPQDHPFSEKVDEILLDCYKKLREKYQLPPDHECDFGFIGKASATGEVDADSLIIKLDLAIEATGEPVHEALAEADEEFLNIGPIEPATVQTGTHTYKAGDKNFIIACE